MQLSLAFWHDAQVQLVRCVQTQMRGCRPLCSRVLGYPARRQAAFIHDPGCVGHHDLVSELGRITAAARAHLAARTGYCLAFAEACWSAGTRVYSTQAGITDPLAS